MPDFHRAITVHKDRELTLEEQKKAGMPVKGDIGKAHLTFMENLIKLVQTGEIDPYNQHSFLKQEVYDALDEEWQDKIDLALVNIANQVRLVYEYWVNTEIPNDSPQLHTMVEQLWAMKQAIEAHHDVFKF